ncbi:helix-turn-helix domain-containing protein [Streptomyces sp. NPDC048606]|uniref:transcriptional regulator n=1 Tax=Streptomyces sp. NPDC048606 TaxID=3154726 RepID=UPI0034355A1E
MSSDTAGSDFAGLLRELKDRSGLSYGTLAKRLHMSTSTLHRYCSGDVVPTEYAPLERFARLCKASPEELLALHRSWVLADANRPRKGAVAGAAGTPAPAVRRSAEPPSAPAPEATAPAAGDGDGDGPAGAAVEAVEAGAEVQAGAGADVAGLPGPAEGPGPKRRRRFHRAVLAGIAVAVVAGTIALTAHLAERGTDVRDRPVGAASLAGDGGEAEPADGKPAPAGTHAGAASGSATPTGASPTDGASTGGASGAAGTPGPPAVGAGPAATPAAGGEAGAGMPLAVTTQPYTWESPCGQHYLIDRPPTEVGPPPAERDAPAWVAASGAVSSGEQYVTLTLQGSGKETVVLDSLTVRTAAKRSPLAWNDYAMGYPGVGCGAGVPTRSFTVALDAARPAVVPEAGQPNFPFKVSESDPEVFHIKADASAYDVSWYLELAWSSGSRHGTLKIDHNGRPFRTSGLNGRPAFEFPLGGDGWVKAGTTS